MIKIIYLMVLFIIAIQAGIVVPDQCETYTTWESHYVDVQDGCKIKRCVPGCLKCTAFGTCIQCQAGFIFTSGILKQFNVGTICISIFEKDIIFQHFNQTL
ncbi:hypothetical protein pb186bvf_004347 [Paramecium bursaria]